MFLDLCPISSMIRTFLEARRAGVAVAVGVLTWRWWFEACHLRHKSSRSVISSPPAGTLAVSDVDGWLGTANKMLKHVFFKMGSYQL